MDDISRKYDEQLKMKIIAVDFDNTITMPCPYPRTGILNTTAKKYLDKLHDAGFTLVLWSARLSDTYDEAYNLCIDNFKMPYIQRDTDELIHGSTGKLLASFYIDDLAYPGKKINWRKLYRHIIRRFK